MKFTAAFSLCMASVAQGAQDTAYYPGFSNPNTKDEMYYREAVNVIQDMQAGEFDSLYIRYHSCVWSEYGSGENQEEGEESGCGGDGSEAAWYMGRTQCFRANVGYSLYGIKAGRTSATPCSTNNYINSFFTTGGIESFGDYVGVAYGDYGVSTTCTATYVGDNDDNGDEQQDGDRSNPSHGKMYYSDYTSTTLGCSARGQFIAATFEGAYCDGNHFLSNDGAITYLNQDLENLGCYKIYDASSNDDEENGDGDGSSALYLLDASASCSHTEYPNRCPDPHGVKRKRDEDLFNYAQSHYRSVPLIMPILSTLLLLGAATMYCLANGVRDAAKRRAVESATGEAQHPSVYEQFSVSFNRITTDISGRTRTFTEKLAQYAEEEEEDETEPISDYTAPDVAASEPKEGSESAASKEEPESESAAAKEEEQTPARAASPDTSLASAASAAVASVTSAAKSVRSEKAPSMHSTLAVEAAKATDPPAAQSGVADSMLAEKGIAPKATTEAPTKKYKRPRMAKISKWIRGRFGRRKTAKA